MRKYVVDECADTAEALQHVLDNGRKHGWRVISTMWLDRRDSVGGNNNMPPQFVIVFETEDSNA